MIWDSTSTPLVQRIKSNGLSTGDSIKAAIRDAARWKPNEYSDKVNLCRDYYNDNQTHHILKQLKARFKESWQNIPVYPTPLFKRMCQMLSTIYQQRPQRELVNKDGGKVVRDDDATLVMADIYREGSVDNVLGIAEEMASAAGLCLLRIGWDSVNSVVDVIPYWPDKVWIFLDADAPTKLPRCTGLIAEIASESGVDTGLDFGSDRKRYEVWSINSEGRWDMHHVKVGQDRWEWQYDSDMLPWVAMPFTKPLGTLFTAPSTDDITVNVAHSVMLGDLLYTVQMQAFGQLTYSGDSSNLPADVGVGAGMLLQAGADGQFSMLNAQPSIGPVMDAIDTLTSQHLNLRSADPSAASADPTYESGVALKVKQLPAMQRRAKRRPVFEWMEERELWPVIQYVSQHPDIAKTHGTAMKWAPGEMELPLDDEAQMRVSQTRVAANISTWPEEMVNLGMAVDVDDARRKYDENKEYNEQQGTVSPDQQQNAAPVKGVDDDKDRDSR